MNFNTEDLISEVGKRPALWDMKNCDYSDKVRRRRCWEEIADIFSNKECNENEKIELSGLLQKKWKNVRDRFCREISERKGNSGDGRKKRAPYMYATQLEFLRDSIEFRKTSCSLMNNTIELSSTPSASTETEVNFQEEEENTRPTSKRKSRCSSNVFEKKINGHVRKKYSGTTGERKGHGR